MARASQPRRHIPLIMHYRTQIKRVLPNTYLLNMLYSTRFTTCAIEQMPLKRERKGNDLAHAWQLLDRTLQMINGVVCGMSHGTPNRTFNSTATACLRARLIVSSIVRSIVCIDCGRPPGAEPHTSSAVGTVPPSPGDTYTVAEPIVFSSSPPGGFDGDILISKTNDGMV